MEIEYGRKFEEGTDFYVMRMKLDLVIIDYNAVVIAYGIVNNTYTS